MPVATKLWQRSLHLSPLPPNSSFPTFNTSLCCSQARNYVYDFFFLPIITSPHFKYFSLSCETHSPLSALQPLSCCCVLTCLKSLFTNLPKLIHSTPSLDQSSPTLIPTVYVHCRDEGCVGRVVRLLWPGGFPGPERCPEGRLEDCGGLKVGGDVQPVASRFKAVYAVRPFSHHLSIPRDVSDYTSLKSN